MSFVKGTNIGIIGVKKEDSFKAGVDYTTTSINPVFVNTETSIELTPNIEKGLSKTYNSRNLPSQYDATIGNIHWTFSIGGDIKREGFGFILAMFLQDFSYNTTAGKMIFNLDSDTYNCFSKTFTFLIPRVCNGEKKTEVLKGVIPQSLELDFIAGTYKADFVVADYSEITGGPVYPDNYNALTNYPNYKKQIGRLYHNGYELATESLTLTISYNVELSNGLYGTDGKLENFFINGVEVSISYSTPYAEPDTTKYIAKDLWDNLNATNIRAFSLKLIDGINEITSDFTGHIQNEKRETGAEFWKFSCDIIPAGAFAMKTKDSYGDITAEI